MISFGLSRSYAQMIVSRILGGVEGGSHTCIRVMAAEMSTKVDEAQIFTWIGVAYRTGQVLGQPIGGALAHPERRFPKLFNTEFWRAYPYALPCFVAAGYALLCALVGQIVLKETLRSKRDTKTTAVSVPSASSDETTALLSNESSNLATPVQKPKASPSILSLLNWPLVSLLISVVAMVLLNEFVGAAYPLFAFTPVALGGLGLSEAQIGLHLSARSSLMLLNTLPFSPLSDRFGKMNVYRFSMFAWIPTIILFPVLNRIARAGGEGGMLWYAMLLALWTLWSVTGWTWSELFNYLLSAYSSCISLVAVFLISSDLSPSPEAMATIQGMLSVAIIGPTAFAPALGTSAFALAIKFSHIFGGYLFWVGTLTFGEPTPSRNIQDD